MLHQPPDVLSRTGSCQSRSHIKAKEDFLTAGKREGEKKSQLFDNLLLTYSLVHFSCLCSSVRYQLTVMYSWNTCGV